MGAWNKGSGSIVDLIESKVTPGMVIPKPQARADFVVKGWGKRRGERALTYTIPNHKNAYKPYQKGITVSEFEGAFDQLMSSGEFSRSGLTVR